MAEIFSLFVWYRPVEEIAKVSEEEKNAEAESYVPVERRRNQGGG
jgi:hypothetical protein